MNNTDNELALRIAEEIGISCHGRYVDGVRFANRMGQDIIAFAARLKAAWLEQYGKSVQSIWEAFCGDDVVEINDYERDLIQAGYASREPEIQALREEVERLRDLLGKANAMCRIRQERIKELTAAQLSERKLREALIMIYDKWENGQDCYEDVEELSGYSGKAVNLSEEEENQILSLIPSVLNGNTSPTNTDEADKLIKALEVAKDALQKLSCLGNGERPGNSVGNSIAQEAIATINELGLTK